MNNPIDLNGHVILEYGICICPYNFITFSFWKS